MVLKISENLDILEMIRPKLEICKESPQNENDKVIVL